MRLRKWACNWAWRLAFCFHRAQMMEDHKFEHTVYGSVLESLRAKSSAKINQMSTARGEQEA